MRAFQPDGHNRPANPYSSDAQPEEHDAWEKGYDEESRKGTMAEDED
ncbi:hypothetical protein [Methylobacterium sp. Leaf361]|nr:hypothetical protein [Methylobacterium sp. Leaf361]